MKAVGTSRLSHARIPPGTLAYDSVCRLARICPGAQEPRCRLGHDHLDGGGIPGVVGIDVQAVAPMLQFLTHLFVNPSLQAYHRGVMTKGGKGRREAV